MSNTGLDWVEEIRKRLAKVDEAHRAMDEAAEIDSLPLNEIMAEGEAIDDLWDYCEQLTRNQGAK